MTDTTPLKRLLAAASVAVACVMPVYSAAHTQDAGTVVGCITEKSTGQPLPDATVDVGGDGRHRIVQSDARGCYAVPDVPAGSYFVFARVHGFVSVTHDNLSVAPGRSESVDFQMPRAGMCECLIFPDTLATLWHAADAVVRVRIIGHDANPQPRYRAALVSVWKRNPNLNTSEALTFVRYTENDEAEPYAVGQDFVIFLKWSSAEQVFVRMSSGYGPIGAFALENGRIHSAPISSWEGLEAEQLVNELSSLAAR
jgi:hypothetical protein